MTTSSDRASWLRAALGLSAGETAFPWQTRLLDCFIRGALPGALDIPTGLGKTAVMAIWLVARACGAPVPRRLVYVVDRRAVVDQASAVAEQLRAWVERDGSVRAALGIGGSLPVSTLRGQYIDNRAWLEDPGSPAIVLGTVDMIGSRLLFGGYGVSRKMRPYHAGLLGSDALIVLDEAHLVPPFERLVERIATGTDAHGRLLGPSDPALNASVPPLRFLSLSATGRHRQAEDTFGLADADADHEVVRRRLSADKRVMLMGGVSAKDLPEALAEHAWQLTANGAKPFRIIVFCTSRDHAQKVQAALHKLASKPELIDTELFVGGRRVHEREEAARWLEARGFIAGSTEKPTRATFVIATAAGEVGVDLDADHAVCDLVAWERMVQRLGRVNRRGDGNAVVVVIPADTDDERETMRRDAVRELLQTLPRTRDGALDASPRALAALKSNPELRTLLDQASTPAPLHPPLTLALVEAWAMTSLEEHTGRPEVAPWIRGWPDEDEPAQTNVVWRTHLPITDDGRLFSRQDLETFRESADPHLAERLETETDRVLDWLVKRTRTLRPPLPDEAGLARCDRPLRDSDVVAVVLDPSFGGDRALRVDDLSGARKRDTGWMLRGATLVVDKRLRGLASGLLKDDAEELAQDVTEIEDGGPTRLVPFRIRRTNDADDARVSEGWRMEVSIALRRTDDGETAWLIVESLAGQLAGSEDGRSGAKRAQWLDEHQEWTESAAMRIARALVLPPELTELLAVGARLHDEGKKAERWQRAFSAPGGGEPPYAKTTSRPNIAMLDGYRHELGSLPYAEAHERVKALSPALRELCLHLIAAHHGGARPLIRTSGAPEPPSRLAERAREIALRYSALSKTWGPWGLAWWEALLRAADQQASRRNDLKGASHG
jgi:CRISPR-associated endonuclease/helicase Cas3